MSPFFANPDSNPVKELTSSLAPYLMEIIIIPGSLAPPMSMVREPSFFGPDEAIVQEAQFGLGRWRSRGVGPAAKADPPGSHEASDFGLWVWGLGKATSTVDGEILILIRLLIIGNPNTSLT